MIAAVAASLAVADLAFAETEGPPPHVTDTVVICDSPVGVGKVSNCRGRVIDATSPADKRVTPTGNLQLSASQGDIAGVCKLEQVVKGRSECTFGYIPRELGSTHHQLTAAYPGQVGNEVRAELEPSQTTTEVEVFTPALTLTRVVCDPDIVSPDIPSTCSVVVTDTVGGLATPLRGNISFSTDAQGGFSGAPCALIKIDDFHAGCEVVYTPTRARVAPHNITAAYAGDPLRAGSVDVEQVSVSNDPTTLTCAPADVTVGHSTTCTMTVEDINDPALLPTGGVTFESDRSGSFTPGGCELTAPPAETRISRCQVTYTPSRVGGGAHTVAAAYQGDNNHSRSRKTTRLTVSGHQSHTTLTCSPTLVKSGTLTTCTATVSDEDDAATTPTGTVNFKHTNQGGFPPPASCTLSGRGAVVSCSVTYLPGAAGSHNLIANYQGDEGHDESSGGTEIKVPTLQEEEAAIHPTATTVVCDPSPVELGESSRCVATVEDISVTPTVPSTTVEFISTEGGTFSKNGVCTLAPVGPSEPGRATCDISYTPSVVGTGVHEIVAGYEGDPTHQQSQGIDPLIVIPEQHETTATLTCEPNPVESNHATTCTATVRDISQLGASRPSGLVSFESNSAGAFSGEGVCELLPVQGPNGANTSSCQLTYTSSGVAATHRLTADYPGDAEHTGDSDTFDLAVTADGGGGGGGDDRNPTTATLTCGNPVEANRSTTCTVEVRDIAPRGVSAPGETVTFDSAASGTFSDEGECELTPVQGPAGADTSSCTITYTPEDPDSTPDSPAVTHRLTADYGGDEDHSGDSDNFDLAVIAEDDGGDDRNPTAAKLTCGNPVEANHASTCTVEVRDIASEGTLAPAGLVTFGTESDGAFSDEAECELVPLQGPAGAASSSCTVTYTPEDPESAPGDPASTHRLEAEYAGDDEHIGDSDTFDLAVLADNRGGGGGDDRNPTTAKLTCGNPVEANHASTCTVEVRDIAPTDASAPRAEVTFDTRSSGEFSDGGECELTPLQGPAGADTSSCTVTYTPEDPESAPGDPASTHRLEAEYAGDLEHTGDGDTFDLAVLADNGGGGGGDDRNPTTAKLTCGNPVEANHPTTCTAEVRDIAPEEASAPGETVTFDTTASGTFSDGGECELTPLQGPAGADTSSCTVTYTPEDPESAPGDPASTHRLEAEYAGDEDHIGDSDTFDLAVTADGGGGGGGDDRNPTAATLTCGNPVEANHPTTCTAEVRDISPAGASAPRAEVTFDTRASGEFSDGGECELTPLQGPAGADTSSCTVTYTPDPGPNGEAGTHRLEAEYAGDLEHTGDSDTFDLAVLVDNGGGGGGDEKDPTTTAIECLPANVILGGGSVCTVTVSDTAAADPVEPTGSFDLQTNGPGEFFNTCTLAPSGPAESRCQAVYIPNEPGAAPHVITAAYPGDDGHEGSQAQTAVAVQVPNGGHETATELNCEPRSVIVEAVSVCTVNVKDFAANGAKAPTGGIVFGSDGPGDFSSGGCVLFAVANDESRCQLIYEPTLVGSGNHEITAIYSGNPGHEPSRNTDIVEVSARNGGHPTSTALDCPANAVIGTAITCTATVTDTDPNAPTPPTRAVVFASDSAGVFGIGGCQLEQPVGATASCRFTYTPLALDSGTHRIFAAYEGDATHEPSQLTFDQATVTAPPTGPGPGPGSKQDPKQDPPKVTPPPLLTAPNTVLRKKPRKKSAKAKAKFKFVADQAGSSFQCKLDKKPFKPCRSPFKKKVKPGRHTFKVRAVNPQGLVDPTPAVFKWRVGKGKGS